MTTSQKSNAKGFLATLAAAIAAAVASSLCCIGPLIYLVFGVSAAGLSGIEKLGWLQFPMIAVSSVLIIMGFWRLYFSRKPFCRGSISRFQMLCLYWIAVPIVLAFQLYPFVLPWLLEVLE
ncbi:mercuric transporter MerT family protein [Limnobaculum zhutongyuii]|uniref:mercuric transporter MerT family protein n=1 Tax=Limnobaculum zhutongyuii TaxID=2498113 RepID=UPI001AEF83FE|nr:mercuric transporter MerT family protein [Limnobaculum zhutongyuii]